MARYLWQAYVAHILPGSVEMARCSRCTNTPISSPEGGTWWKGGYADGRPDRVPSLRPLRFTTGPFSFKNWFRYRSPFCKMLKFWWIFPLVYLQVVKKYLCNPIYMIKSDWFKKRALQETNGFNQRLQICVISGLLTGWWLKLQAGDPRTQLKFE